MSCHVTGVAVWFAQLYEQYTIQVDVQKLKVHEQVASGNFSCTLLLNLLRLCRGLWLDHRLYWQGSSLFEWGNTKILKTEDLITNWTKYFTLLIKSDQNTMNSLKHLAQNAHKLYFSACDSYCACAKLQSRGELAHQHADSPPFSAQAASWWAFFAGT